MPSSTHTDSASKIDRVRLRVTKLMHLTHRADAAPVPAPAIDSETRAAAEDRIAARLAGLTDDLRSLQLLIQDTEKLIRQGWDVAVDLNQIRRRCRRCEAAGGLPEAIGFYQRLLNEGRYNTRAATRAITAMIATAETCQVLSGNGDGAPAFRASAHLDRLESCKRRA
jgi:hypothetical protein